MHARREPQRPRPPALDDRWALFLDVDGSLIDFAETPDNVTVPSGLRELLYVRSQRLQGALALISGRTVEAIDNLFWPLRLPAAGLHGNQWRMHGAARAPEPSDALRLVLAEAVTLSMRHRGAVVENKHSGIALHWRSAPDAAEPFRAFAEAALARLPGYRLQPGDCVLELLRGHADKGTAIAEFLNEPPFLGRTPVFVGDDLTDEDGFRTVNALGGLSILVGARARSLAKYALRDPADVRDWLRADLHTDAHEGPR